MSLHSAIPRLRWALLLAALLTWLAAVCAIGLARQPRPRWVGARLPLRVGQTMFGFVGDGQAYVTGNAGATFALWDPLTGAKRAEAPWPAQASTVAAFAPDGKTWAVLNKDNSIGLWDRASGQQVATLKGYTAIFSGLQYAPDSQTLLTAGDGSVRLWDVPTGRERLVLRHGDGALLAAVFSPDGRTLASTVLSGQGVRVRLWETGTGREQGSFPIPLWIERSSLTFTPDGRCLATGHPDGTVRIWDLASGRERARYVVGGNSPRLAFSPDSRLLATYTFAEDPRYQRLTRWFGSGLAQPLAPSPWRTVVFDVASGQEQFRLPNCLYPTFLADGKSLATFNGNTDALTVWDVPPARVLPAYVPWAIAGVALLLSAAWWRGWRRGRATEPAASTTYGG